MDIKDFSRELLFLHQFTAQGKTVETKDEGVRKEVGGAFDLQGYDLLQKDLKFSEKSVSMEWGCEMCLRYSVFKKGEFIVPLFSNGGIIPKTEKLVLSDEQLDLSEISSIRKFLESSVIVHDNQNAIFTVGISDFRSTKECSLFMNELFQHIQGKTKIRHGNFEFVGYEADYEAIETRISELLKLWWDRKVESPTNNLLPPKKQISRILSEIHKIKEDCGILEVYLGFPLKTPGILPIGVLFFLQNNGAIAIHGFNFNGDDFRVRIDILDIFNDLSRPFLSDLKRDSRKKLKTIDFNEDSGQVYMNDIFVGVVPPESNTYYFMFFLYENLDEIMTHEEIQDFIKSNNSSSDGKRLTAQAFANGEKAKLKKCVPQIEDYLKTVTGGYILSSQILPKTK